MNCISLCSTAFAIKKSTAKHFFTSLYNSQTLIQDGQHDFIRDHRPAKLPLDWALLNYFLNSRNFDSLHSCIVGYNIPFYGDQEKGRKYGVIMERDFKLN